MMGQLTLRRCPSPFPRHAATTPPSMHLQLHKILQAIHDLDASVGGKDGDIAAVEPALGVEGLGRLVRLLEVPGSHSRAPDQDLPTAPAPLAVVVPVTSEVGLAIAVQARGDGGGGGVMLGRLQAGPQPDLHRGHGGAHDTVAGVGGVLHAA